MARSFLTLATAALATTAALAALQPPAGNFVDGACVKGYVHGSASDAAVDLFPAKAAPGSEFKREVSSDYSLLWDVTYHKHYKVINATNAALVAGSNAVKYAVLYQCGTPRPDLSATLGTVGVNYYSIPITKAAVTSTTYLPLLEILGERKSIVAYTSSFSYVSSPCLKKMKEIDLTTKEVNTGDWTAKNGELTTLGVQVSFADSWSSSALNAWVMTDTKETSSTVSALLGGSSAALQSAEYLKLVSLFFNREAEANAAFDTILNRYVCTAKDVKAQIAEAGATNTPNVLWASYSTDGAGISGWSVGTCPSYYCEAIKTAGGKMIEFTGVVGEINMWGGWTKALSTAQLLEKATTADVWFHAGNWSTNGAKVFDAGSASVVPAVKNGRVFDTQGKGANDWFESRVAEPDVFLRDIASALHPNHASLGKRGARAWIRRHDEWVNERKDEACTDTNAKHTLGGDGQEWCPTVENTHAAAFLETPSGIATIVVLAIVAAIALVALVVGVVAVAVVVARGKQSADGSSEVAVMKGDAMPTVVVPEEDVAEVEMVGAAEGGVTPATTVTVVA
jgi:iron complex transport system substrate-binding protein